LLELLPSHTLVTMHHGESLPPGGHSCHVTYMRFSADGTWLASTGDADRALMLWRVAGVDRGGAGEMPKVSAPCTGTTKAEKAGEPGRERALLPRRPSPIG
jgi:WD40 repeat protein